MGYNIVQGRWAVQCPEYSIILIGDFPTAREARAYAAKHNCSHIVRCEASEWHSRVEPVWTRYWRRRHGYRPYTRFPSPWRKGKGNVDLRLQGLPAWE